MAGLIAYKLIKFTLGVINRIPNVRIRWAPTDHNIQEILNQLVLRMVAIKFGPGNLFLGRLDDFAGFLL